MQGSQGYQIVNAKYVLGVYVAIVCLSAIAFLFFLFWGLPPARLDWFSLGFWLIFSFVAHLIQFEGISFRGHAVLVSVGFAASAACIVLFEPAQASILVMLSSLSWRTLTGRLEWQKVVFNRAMFAICGGAGSLVFRFFLTIKEPPDPIWMVVSALLAAMMYFIINSVLVSLAIHISLGGRGEIWRTAMSAIPMASYLTLAATGIMLALVYVEIGPVIVFLFATPLLASYYALQNTVQVRRFYTSLLRSFAIAMDIRERETAGHSERLAVFARKVGEVMGLREAQRERFYGAGLLHDVGKLGWSDGILLKSGLLTDEEWAIVRQHPINGARLLDPYPHLKEVSQIVRHHHERYDGTGYPDGLKGEEVPLGARILAVVDAFDAMYAGRPYRSPMKWEEIMEELERGRGTQFDPQVLDAFFKVDWRRVMEEELEGDKVIVG